MKPHPQRQGWLRQVRQVAEQGTGPQDLPKGGFNQQSLWEFYSLLFKNDGRMMGKWWNSWEKTWEKMLGNHQNNGIITFMADFMI